MWVGECTNLGQSRESVWPQYLMFFFLNKILVNIWITFELFSCFLLVSHLEQNLIRKFSKFVEPRFSPNFNSIFIYFANALANSVVDRIFLGTSKFSNFFFFRTLAKTIHQNWAFIKKILNLYFENLIIFFGKFNLSVCFSNVIMIKLIIIVKRFLKKNEQNSCNFEFRKLNILFRYWLDFPVLL